MRSERTICIFFEDLRIAAQKRIVEHELVLIDEDYGLEVETIRIDKDMYGYDKDPAKQELLESVHVSTNRGCWLMVWDCMEAEFQTIVGEDQI